MIPDLYGKSGLEHTYIFVLHVTNLSVNKSDKDSHCLLTTFDRAIQLDILKLKIHITQQQQHVELCIFLFLQQLT